MTNLQQLKKEVRSSIIKRILSERGCRSHEPENCNICEERQRIIDSLDEDFIDSLITKAYEERKRKRDLSKKILWFDYVA